ncbi:PREDICTED: uncharacterized protein LOC109464571 [Branchiostoma belcheri]|uniref:Uncharacterized protein LOC109464571 n=1 Tax=Branchiostoma belcheri TaxID=7741 RepID=A0A6P4XKQ0_BRABE|nr:PREDICTED: uncharacterized protein LOC109464571 [Branchiostoma belcheri]
MSRRSSAPNEKEGLHVADFVRETKDFSSENRRSSALISQVLDKLYAERTRLSEFENKCPNLSEWDGLSALKGVNLSLREKCQSCAEEVRRNAEKQKEDYRFIWETIVATKQSVQDFLRKLGLGQYTTAFTGLDYEEVEDLLDADIKKDKDLDGGRCWVVLHDDEGLVMVRRHRTTLKREIDNIRERVANIPHRMESIINSASEAARTSNRFCQACEDSIERARPPKSEARTAAREARQRPGNTDHSSPSTAASIVRGAGIVLAATTAGLSGGLSLMLAGLAHGATGVAAIASVYGAAGVGMAAMKAREDNDRASSSTSALSIPANLAEVTSDISSDTFEEKVTEDLNDHQRKMGEKVQELQTEWLNKIYTCVTKMESTNAAVKHKLVALPSSADEVKSIQSNIDSIFENLETVSPTTNGMKYETNSAFRDKGESNTYCPICETSPCLSLTYMKLFVLDQKS